MRLPWESDDPIRVVLIDVEEQPIERPTENQQNHYSGKKNGIRRGSFAESMGEIKVR